MSPISGNFLQTLVKKVLPCAFSRPAESSDPALAPAICNPSLQERGWSRYALPAVFIAIFIVAAVYVSSTLDLYPYSGRFPRAKAEFLKPGRLDRKLSTLEKKIKNNPDDIRAFFESGLLKFQKGPERYIDAISDLETARSGGLADIRLFYYLGQMYQAVGLYDFEDALPLFRFQCRISGLRKNGAFERTPEECGAAVDGEPCPLGLEFAHAKKNV